MYMFDFMYKHSPRRLSKPASVTTGTDEEPRSTVDNYSRIVMYQLGTTRQNRLVTYSFEI